MREELLGYGEISQVNLLGVRDYQIDVEIPEETLRKHGLTLQQVASTVRRWNIDLPGGSMKTESQEVLLLDPDNVIAYKRMGSAYKEMGLMDRALECWKKALSLDPADEFTRSLVAQFEKESAPSTDVDLQEGR